MHPLIYDVAVSIDGYIDGPDGDISAFAQDGPVVEDYQKRMATYACAVMGRATYEFGYRFGLAPGQNPYPHMDTYVFSKTLAVPADSNLKVIRDDAHAVIADLKTQQAGPIYLCGGGQFAGSLLALDLIDIVRLKRAPIILGGGTPLFGGSGRPAKMTSSETKLYDGGYLFQEFVLS